jgi:phage repressor protein C with HTH and peptisase S24 domain
MKPIYEPGELIFIDPARPIRGGDIVVVQTEEQEGDNCLAWLKEYVRTTSDGTIITIQYNARAEVKFTGDQVRAMHRVLTTNEIFGVSENDI